MVKISSFLVLFGLIILSCSGETKQAVETYKEVIIDEPISETDQDVWVQKPIHYTGYIGTYPVTADIDFDYSNEVISGSYFYDKHKKDIELVGYIEMPEGTWTNYYIYERDNNGDTIAVWYLEDSGIDYYIEGSWTTEKGDNLYFKLVTERYEDYLDPESMLSFETKSAADKFYKYHHFLHDQVRGKQGLILANNEDDQYSYPLPIGLPIYKYGVNEGYDIGLWGEIDENGNLALDQREPVSFYDHGVTLTKFIGYEEFAYVFSEVRDDSLIILPAPNYNDLCIKISDLERFGYHLEGDGYWLKKNSGSVMGYFPDYLELVNGESTHPIITIYEQPELHSNQLLEVEFEKQNGFFKVEDVKGIPSRGYWIEVEFDYYTQEPCSDEVYDDKPSVYGWIPLYTGGSLAKQVVLGFYSKGC